VVIPCYNERGRLDEQQVGQLLADARLRILFVDDGSSDGTGEMLADLRCRHGELVDVHSLASNRGKAEAVRQGMLAALESSIDYVGYLDADFATPANEFGRLLTLLSTSPQLSAVLGARVSMLGVHIDRRPLRHYLGRVFATGASLVLGMPVYDTQCGAKVFRASPRLRDALSEPFVSRWVFDVELLSRLTVDGYESTALQLSELKEVPLEEWRDVGGSKVSALDAVRMAKDMGTIWRDRRAMTRRERTRASSAPAETLRESRETTSRSAP
jgi:glycosyltransferase involved in cell wall biosynthesis